MRKIKRFSNNYYSLTLAPHPKAKNCRPGHFAHILVPSTDVTFRRAFSIASIAPESNEFEIIFKVVGRGTRLLADLNKGDTVNALAPLGVPFSLPPKSETILMVGGGIGFPPLLFLATELVKRGHDAKKIEFLYGGRSRDDLLERSRIKKLGVSFRPITEDGSLGEKGLVTQPMQRLLRENENRSMRVYSCGPAAMLRAVDKICCEQGIPGQVSLEAPMPCGIGVCLGCVLPLKRGGYTRVCYDGPVYDVGEVVL